MTDFFVTVLGVRVPAWWRAFCQLQMAKFSLCPHKDPWKDTDPFHKLPHSCLISPNYIPEFPHFLTPSPFGGRVLKKNLGEMQTVSS